MTLGVAGLERLPSRDMGLRDAWRFGLWATIWATTTGAAAIQASSGNGSAGIDPLHTEQLVRPDGVPSGGRPPQNPRVDASWEVIAADALCCNGSADFPVVFPRELRCSRFLP